MSLMALMSSLNSNGVLGTSSLTDLETQNTASRTTSRIPGKIPAINNWSILTLATMAYTISGRLGGKRSPKVPEVVSRPSENPSEYRPRLSQALTTPIFRSSNRRPKFGRRVRHVQVVNA